MNTDGDNMIKLNSEITKNELIRMTEPIEYYFGRLLNINYLIKKFRNHLVNSYADIETIECHNSLIEASLAIIRIEYEFFFKFELFDCDSSKLNTYINSKNRKDDIFAEYYFDKPETWYEVKQKNQIDFNAFQIHISKKDTEKYYLHLTNTEKRKWVFEPVLVGLYRTNEIFYQYSDLFKEYNSSRQGH